MTTEFSCSVYVAIDCIYRKMKDKRDSSPKNENYPMVYSASSLPVYDFLLSDEYSQSYIKNVLALPSFVIAVNVGQDLKKNKAHSSIIKRAAHGSRGLIKAFRSESMHFCWKYIHI